MWELASLPEVQQMLAEAEPRLAVAWAVIAMAVAQALKAWQASRQSNRQDERDDSQRDYAHEVALQRRRSQRGVLQPMWEKYGLPGRSEADWDQWASIPAPPQTPSRGFDWQGMVGGLMSGASQGLANEQQSDMPDWFRNLSPEMQEWMRSQMDPRNDDRYMDKDWAARHPFD